MRLKLLFSEVTLPVDIELASATQELQGSATPELVLAVSTAIDSKELKLVEITLRDGTYWWSTRLYLLAALAEEYTSIERLIFVESNADRAYVGMASPSAVRRALAKRFPGVERVFRETQANSKHIHKTPSSQVKNIGDNWPNCSFRPDDSNGTKCVLEDQIREIVTRAKVTEWLGSHLETEFREWNGGGPASETFSKVLSCNGVYVPLLNLLRLEKVVDRTKLSTRLASVVVG